MKDYVLECIGVSKTYIQHTIPVTRLQDRLLRWGNGGHMMEIEALKPTSLSIERGEWVGIYGPNGSGKTTFMKILAGLLRPDTGTVRRHGKVSSFFELGIGFHPERAARENIYLHGLLHGFGREQIAHMTEKIITFADISPFADLPLKCYSTGMRLRLAFAAAAYTEADVYLLDEVLAVGDVDFQQKCMRKLLELKAAGKTVVFVSHTFHHLAQLSHRILFFGKGVIAGQRKKVRWKGDTDLHLVPQAAAELAAQYGFEQVPQI